MVDLSLGQKEEEKHYGRNYSLLVAFLTRVSGNERVLSSKRDCRSGIRSFQGSSRRDTDAEIDPAKKGAGHSKRGELSGRV